MKIHVAQRATRQKPLDMLLREMLYDLLFWPFLRHTSDIRHSLFVTIHGGWLREG